jgi:hypothetical protein
MSKQKIGGVALMIFGIIVLLYVKIFPSFITFFRGNIWKIALIFMGILFVLLGVLILFIKKISF